VSEGKWKNMIYEKLTSGLFNSSKCCKALRKPTERGSEDSFSYIMFKKIYPNIKFYIGLGFALD